MVEYSSLQNDNYSKGTAIIKSKYFPIKEKVQK